VLLSRVRRLAEPHLGKAINLRITPKAIEFDLFVPPDTNLTPILAALKGLGDIITCKRLDIPPTARNANEIVLEARHLFNEYRFWEVHEVLEDLWKKCEGREKALVQGLILCAAAFVHAQKNETTVVWSLLADGIARLNDQPSDYYGWNIEKFRTQLSRDLADKRLDFPTV
jgi:hypothetical protein